MVLRIASMIAIVLMISVCFPFTWAASDELSKEIECLLAKPAPSLPSQIRIPQNAEVLKHLKRITGPEHAGMQKALDRSAPWREPIEKLIADRGLPPGLIAVVLQESAFKSDAVSRTGAGGLWQFKPATARLFNLRHDAFIDQRFAPEAATQKALDYLVQLRVQFGDWALAFAAYNWGKGALSDCIQKNGGLRDFWKLSQKGGVRAETRNYVPGILARLTVWRDPGKYGFSIPPKSTPVKIEVPPLTDLISVEKALGMGAGTISRLNPQLRTQYTPPYDSLGSVWAPAKVEKALRKMISNRKIRFHVADPKRLNGVTRKVHTLRSGQTLWALTQKYNTSLQSLLAYNHWETAPSLMVGSKVVVFVNPTK